MRAWAVVWLCGLFGWLALTTGCQHCSDSHVLASLAEKQGTVDRDTKANVKQWTKAEVGADFSMGDAVRTGPASSALLHLADGSKLQVQKKTILRFSDQRPKAGEHGFDVETGEALIEAGAKGLVLNTSLGLARIEENTKVLLRRTDRGTRFEVQVGKAVLETKDGQQSQLASGEAVIVTGEAVLERIHPEPEAPEKPTEASEEPAQALPEVAGDIAGVVVGNGVSVKRPDEQKYSPLAPGAVKLPSGSSVSVKTGSSLNVRHGESSALLKGSGSYVLGGGSGALVQMQHGSVSLSGSRTRVMVPGGAIVTSPGAVASVDSVKQGTRVRVQKSQALVQGAQGTESVGAGQEAVLDKDGALKIEGRGLGYADISVSVGDSFVVHDPAPPTAVRFAFGSTCAEGGVIRVKSGRTSDFASGDQSVALPFEPGRYDYSLFCQKDDAIGQSAVGSGNFTVLRDAGTRPVPKKPPSTHVEADGRTYTVMYQNQLPSVSLGWSKAPSAGGFSLVHRSSAGQQNYKLGSPAYSFRSGALQEGQHVFYFEGGGKVSRQTTVRIRFDNKAPTASLKTPAKLKVAPGEKVTIAGVAQPGWKVEINGKAANVDGEQRFSQEAEMPNGQRALAVRLTHPRRGTHIYVRRAAGTHD